MCIRDRNLQWIRSGERGLIVIVTVLYRYRIDVYKRQPPVLTSFLITPMCMSSTADMGINSSTYSFLIDGGLQKAPNAILCRRDIYNTGLHIWHVKLAAQGRCV